MAAETKIVVPAGGAKIHIESGKLVVPDHPIVPFIEGDGTGADIWRSSVRVLDDEFRNERVVLTGHQPMRFADLLEMIRPILAGLDSTRGILQQEDGALPGQLTLVTNLQIGRASCRERVCR